MGSSLSFEMEQKLAVQDAKASRSTTQTIPSNSAVRSGDSSLKPGVVDYGSEPRPAAQQSLIDSADARRRPVAETPSGRKSVPGSDVGGSAVAGGNKPNELARVETLALEEEEETGVGRPVSSLEAGGTLVFNNVSSKKGKGNVFGIFPDKR
jgi:hypothetical protein